MQIKQSVPKPHEGPYEIVCSSAFSFSNNKFESNNIFPLGSEEYRLLDRMEIKLGKDSILNFSKTKPFSREAIIPVDPKLL